MSPSWSTLTEAFLCRLNSSVNFSIFPSPKGLSDEGFPCGKWNFGSTFSFPVISMDDGLVLGGWDDSCCDVLDMMGEDVTAAAEEGVEEGVACRKTTLLDTGVILAAVAGVAVGAVDPAAGPTAPTAAGAVDSVTEVAALLPGFDSDCFDVSSSDDGVVVADGGVTTGCLGDHDEVDPSEAIDILDGVTRGVGDVLAAAAGGLPRVVDSDEVKDDGSFVAVASSCGDGGGERGVGADVTGKRGAGGVAMGMSRTTRWLAGAREVLPPTGRFSWKIPIK